MKKKLLIYLFVLVVCLSFIKTTKVTEHNNQRKHTTFTFFNIDGNAANTDNFKSPVAKEIKKKTGVTLEVRYPEGDVVQKLSVMLASGVLPDLMYAKADQDKFIAAKQYINLAPYIDKYGVNIKKLYGKYMNRLKYSLKDNSIYVLPSFEVGGKNMGRPDTFLLQHAVVKELGYPQLTTLQEAENAIKAYKKKHPMINGQPTIGLSLIADDFRIYVGVNNAATLAGGLPDDGSWIVDPKTYKTKLTATSEAHHDFYKWLNHMNDIGLLDPESFMQKYSQYETKIASGRVLALFDADWEISRGERVLRDKMPERMYGAYPVTIRKGMKRQDYRYVDFSPGWGIGITKSCKNPVRAIKFLNWLCSDEAQVLNNWGIKGKDYVIAKGKRVIRDKQWKKRNSDPLFGKRTGIGMYTYPFPQYGVGVKDKNGELYQPVSKESIIKNYTNIEKDVLRHYGAKVWKDLFPGEKDIPASKWGNAWQVSITDNEDVGVIAKKIDDLMKASVPDMITDKPSKFENNWRVYQEKIKQIGAEKLEKTFDKCIADKIKLYSK